MKKASHTDAEDDEAVALPLAGSRGGIIDVSFVGVFVFVYVYMHTRGFIWRHICRYIYVHITGIE